MLVLSRRSNEGIFIGHDIEVVVLEVRGKSVRLGIRAPREVPVVRTKLAAKLVDRPASSEKSAPREPVSRIPRTNASSDGSDGSLSHFCESRRSWRSSGISQLPDLAILAAEPEPISVVGLG